MASEVIQIGDASVRFLVEAEESGGSVAVFQIDPGARPDAGTPQPRRLRGDDLRTVRHLNPLLGPDFFREAGAVLATAGASSPDFAALAEVMSRHGLTPARPSR